MTTVGSVFPPPMEQQRLREAFMNGDVRMAFRLLKPRDSCFASPIGRVVSSILHCRVPSVDYVYVDDAHNRLVLYLAGAKGRQIGMQTLFRWLDIFFHVRAKTAGSNDEARAKLMEALVAAGYPLDFSVHNAMRGVAHFCVTSNSVHVLRTMLRLTHRDDHFIARRPNLQLEDCEGRTPLSYALEAQNLECIRLLVAGGALQGLTQPFEHLVEDDALDDPVEGHPGEGPSRRLLSAMLCREKRVKHLEKRLSSCDCEDDIEHEGMTSMAVEEVQGVLFSDIETLMSWKSLDPSSAVTLLSKHRYDLQSALQASDLTTTTTAAPTTSCGGSSGNHCIVCFEENLPEDKTSIKMPCGHVTCDDCWKGILRQRLSYGDVHKTVCPEPDCLYYFPLTQLSAVLEDQSEQFLRLLNLRYVDNSSSMKWCPRPDCGRVLSVPWNEERGRNTVASCSVDCQCGYSSCWNCLRESHEPATCEQVERWMSVLNFVLAEKRSLDWVKAETVRCPRCKSPIERDGGCNHMSCSVCHQQFCYQCGQKWKGHADHYTCSLANMLSRKQRLRVGVTSRLRSALDEVAKRFKQNTIRNAYEWHLHEYLKHSPNEQELSAAAHYMMDLLRATLPDEQFHVYNQHQQQQNGRREDVQYVKRWLEVLLMAEKIVRNSHILSFNLRSGSTRKKFLSNLQKQLGSSVQQLVLYFTSLPGFSEILPKVNRQAASVRFTQNKTDFHKQFFYVQTLHAHRDKVDEICESVTNSANQLLRAARLDLLHHAKPHKQSLPPSLFSRRKP